MTLVTGIVIAFVFAFLFSRVYDAVTESDGVAALDPGILRAAIGMRSPLIDAIAATIAVVFGPICMPILTALAATAFGVVRRAWTPVLLIAAAGLGSLAMTIAGKDIIGRHRPRHSLAIPPFETSPSFPSGHTLNSVAILGMVAYLLTIVQRRLVSRIATIGIVVVISAAVGVSRIVLGAHWFTDVLSAWLLGLAWLALLITLHRSFQLAHRRRVRAAAAV